MNTLTSLDQITNVEGTVPIVVPVNTIDFYLASEIASNISVAENKTLTESCRVRFGRIPCAQTCDRYNNLGSNVHLNNNPHDHLNSEDDAETNKALFTRLSARMPPVLGNLPALYHPKWDAYCFNEDYPVPVLSYSEQQSLYIDYKNVFDEINLPTRSGAHDNNGITKNRLPGMFLRMCFHDTAVASTGPDFQDYVTESIDPITGKWIGEARYMKTSGADASNLICPEERYHPNQNYDQTASRVLRSIQRTIKSKHKNMSYADILHNGCNAATLYLTGVPSSYLTVNPFTFGRKDACHVDKKCGRRMPLCGPTELLPGLSMSAPEVSYWFTSRGMSNCLFMALMYTHTTVDDMACNCPIKKLVCQATRLDVASFKDKTKLYFQEGDRLNYFNFFLNRGTHKTLHYANDDLSPNCEWMVNGTQVHWPMTAIDCTLGLNSVIKSGPQDLADVIMNFGHNPEFNRLDTLMCALNILSGKGGLEGGACDRVIPEECKSISDHKFGGFYSTLPATTVQEYIDRRPCGRIGYF